MPAFLKALTAFNRLVNTVLATLAGIALIAMMLVTVIDITTRTVGRPIPGSYEIIGWLSAASMGLALGYVQLHRGHVGMTLFADRLQGRAAALASLVQSLFATVLFALICRYLVDFAIGLKDSDSLSETLQVIVHPWVFLMLLGFAGQALAHAVDTLEALGRSLRPASPESGASH